MRENLIFVKMKIAKLFLFSVAALLMCSCKADDPAVRALAERIIPEYADNFRFEVVQDSTDCFEIESVGRKIVIRGNNSNSIAVGLNWYLKNYCLTTVSWYADDPVEMPAVLPEVAEPVKIQARAGERFFLNYCTFGYTMPWWNWNDWERMIDWMALNGVTMPLAITGQEAVWQKVWRKHGLTDEQIRNYFTGPAHLPWHRMTNIDYWDGPLPQEWIDGQVELQKQILQRERELGMTPVLPAFAGHVPQEIKAVYPDAEITRVSYWGGFADEYRCSFLAPMDPLFAEIQKDFLEEQTALFGTDHVYGADPFNEIDSPSWDPETLAKMSSRIYTSIADVDPDAIWLQMGWLFYADPYHWTEENIRAFLGAVPQGRLIMLDYYCEFTQIWTETEEFFGQPYMWCYLGNFGGNTMMTGNFDLVSARIEDTFESTQGNLYGLGSTLEGFGVNQFMYEFVLDKAWDSGMSDEEWVNTLADRRFGKVNPVYREAWQELTDSVYVEFSRTGQATLTCAHPCLTGNWHWTTKPAEGYTAEQMYAIWGKLLEASAQVDPQQDGLRDTYLYDIVNAGRQYLGDHFLEVRDEFTKAYNAKNIKTLEAKGREMLELLDDMDRMVACHRQFSLEEWIEDARTFGETEEQKDYYEQNARTLISVWGDSYHLSDYASRAWSGLISSFYKARWEMFINDVVAAAKAGHKFDQKAFDAKCWEFECGWTKPEVEINFPEAGDALETAKELYTKYAR